MNAPISSNPKRPGSPSRPAALSPHELTLGGITPFTTIDFPGRLAAVLYTQGCAWCCRYCHNSHLWEFRPDSSLPLSEALAFLETRKGLLNGVVFCGGEPTAQEGLEQAMKAIKGMGFEIGLHTTGAYPARLEAVLPLCDWVGMDVKAPFRYYKRVTQKEHSGIHPRQSLQTLLESGVNYEIRTTVHPDLLSERDILEMALELSSMGVRHYVLQAFQPKGCHDGSLGTVAEPSQIISDPLKAKLTSLFQTFQIRY